MFATIIFVILWIDKTMFEQGCIQSLINHKIN